MSPREGNTQASQGSSHSVARAADRYREEGRFDDAIMLCLQELKNRPTYVSARVVLGRAYLERGDLQEAESEFHRVVELSPENLRARVHLGQICEAQGRLTDAIGHYQTALEFAPLNPEIRASLSRLQPLTSPAAPSMKTGGGSALPEPHVPCSSGKEDEGPFATETLADLYASQGLTDRAASIYERLLHGQPCNESIQRKLSALVETRPGNEGAAAEAALLGSTECSTEASRSETVELIGASIEPTGAGSRNLSRGNRDQLLTNELERWLRGVQKYSMLALASQEYGATKAEAPLSLAPPPVSR
jgi:tetratricopeptide (TPR) repeat protein